MIEAHLYSSGSVSNSNGKLSTLLFDATAAKSTHYDLLFENAMCWGDSVAEGFPHVCLEKLPSKRCCNVSILSMHVVKIIYNVFIS